MISLVDATTLAVAKLKTKPLRTVASVTIASLIFAIVAAGSLVLSGFNHSIDQASDGSLARRYIVQVNPPMISNPTTSILRSKSLIAAAEQRFEDLVEQKRLKAEQLGISYSPESEQSPVMTLPDGTKSLNLRASQGILADKYAGQPTLDDQLLQQRADSYGAIDVFTGSFRSIPNGSSLRILPDGHEKFYDTSDEETYNANYTSPILQPVFELMPDQIASAFLFADAGNWSPDSDTIPLVVPADAAEQLLGYDKLPANATSQQKSDRLETLRNHANGYKFQACYRNQDSQDLIQQTVVQNKTSDSDQDDVQPPIEYALPDDSQCTGPTVRSDNRTAQQIEYDQRQAEFDQAFDDIDNPQSFFVDFTIVGLTPYTTEQSPNGNTVGRTLEDILQNLVSASGVEQFIPQAMFEQIPAGQAHKDIFVYEPFYLFGPNDGKQRLLEFANPADAQRFIDQQSCTQQYDGLCKPAGRDYTASLAFSNSVALDDVRQKTQQWFYLAAGAAVILAAIVMWLTISRTIATSRRETAMLRALGFTRGDISLIYSAYTLLLAALTTLAMLALGLGLALTINHLYAPLISSQLQYLFIGSQLPELPLVKIEAQQLLVLVAACILSSLLAMLLPIARNVRRNPIQDMRDEA